LSAAALGGLARNTATVHGFDPQVWTAVKETTIWLML